MASVGPQKQRLSGNGDALEAVGSPAAFFTVAADQITPDLREARSRGEPGIDPGRRILCPLSRRNESTSWYTAQASRRRTLPP